MVTAIEVRDVALKLEGTSEHGHFDRTAFKVVRIYATVAADGQSLNLKLTPEEQEFKVMMAPNIFKALPNKWGLAGWTGVDLQAIGQAELTAALTMAWEHGRAKSGARR